jgi:hypothetical protein
MDFRTVILDSLEGTEVFIPSLCDIFAGWTQGEVNPYYSRLVEASDRRLERYLRSDLAFNKSWADLDTVV